MKSFKQYISENKIEDEFGEYLFGGYFGSEKDTPIESKIFELVVDYFKENKTIPQKYIDKLESLKKEFPEILKPFKHHKTAWRKTMSSDDDKLTEWLEKNKSKVREEGEYFVFPNYIYKPKSSLQSWSTSMRAVSYFTPMKHGSGGYVRNKGSVELILETKIDDTFLFNTKFTGEVGYTDEFEIVRVSKKPIKCDLWLTYKELNQLSILI